MGLWWALRKKGVRLKRLLGGGRLCIAVFYGLFRYDGSADGSAFPSLAWRWQKKDLAAGTPQHHWQSGQLQQPIPAGVADMPRFLGVRKATGCWRNPKLADGLEGASTARGVAHCEIGDGWSGFAVAGNRAITQEQRGDGRVRDVL
jgi:outer membrane protein assembly factor BamB